jgi:hypothetical protein
MEMIDGLGCFGSKREWIPRLKGSFMVGYVKFDNSLNSYRFSHKRNLPEVCWTILGAINVSSSFEVSEFSSIAGTSKFF